MRRRSLWIVDLRELVLARLKQRGLSRYWLASRLAAKGVKRSTVYRWLAGTGDVMSTVAGLALTELEVDLASRFDQWATVRIGDSVVACLVGSTDWERGTFRIVHPDRWSAEKARSERLEYLRKSNR